MDDGRGGSGPRRLNPMKNMLFARAALAAALVEVSVIAASAQTSEGIGIRAQGMGAPSRRSPTTPAPPGGTRRDWRVAPTSTPSSRSGQQQKPIDDRSLPASETVGRGFSVAYPALGVSLLPTAGQCNTARDHYSGRGARPTRWVDPWISVCSP